MTPARTRLFRSIRFRLTVWYALILFIIILLLGFGVAKTLERQLRNDVDRRIHATAVEMLDQFQYTVQFGGRLAVVPPPPDSFSFPSQLIQVVGPDGTTRYSTENLGDRQLPTIPPRGTEETQIRYGTTVLDGETIRVVTYPLVIKRSNVVIGAINVAEPLIQINEMLRNLRRQFLTAAIAGALLAAAAGWFLAGRALKPVDQMVLRAQQIADGSDEHVPFGQRLDVPPTEDELARLATTFNNVLDQMEEVFATQRQFVADASHELRTPLTAIRGNVDLLQMQLDRSGTTSADAAQSLSDLKRESARMTRLTDDLLTLARSEAPGGLAIQCKQLDLTALAYDVARTVLASGPEPPITIEGEEHVFIEGDRDRLMQVMLILCDNARRYTPADGSIVVRVTESHDRAGFSVRDTGPGIDPRDQERIFTRFFRADSSRERASGGAGLGLAIAKAIVQAHDGEISVASTPGTGAIFTVTLPKQGCSEGPVTHR